MASLPCKKLSVAICFPHYKVFDRLICSTSDHQAAAAAAAAFHLTCKKNWYEQKSHSRDLMPLHV
jgi:hypothetical protein